MLCNELNLEIGAMYLFKPLNSNTNEIFIGKLVNIIIENEPTPKYIFIMKIKDNYYFAENIKKYNPKLFIFDTYKEFFEQINLKVNNSNFKSLTYKEKAIDLLVERLNIKKIDAMEIIDTIDRECGFKPCVIGALNAPYEIMDWNEKIQ